MQSYDEKTTRRGFMKDTARYGAGFAALASSQIVGANDRIRIGVIGTGGRASQLLANLLPNAPEAWPGLPQFKTVKLTGADIVAVADVFEPHLDRAADLAGPSTAKYHDYHKLLDQKDIDAVIVASPDHWHKQMLIDAVEAGKDVYVEKPVTHSLEQGPEEIQAVEKTGRIVQTGTQHRSWKHYIQGKEIVDSGALGEVRLVEAYWFMNAARGAERAKHLKTDLSKLDWKAWIGPAPDQPFNEVRYHQWRYFWDFGGGTFTDLMVHAIDTIQWYMDSPAPSSAVTVGHTYSLGWECPDTVSCTLDYPKGFLVSYVGNHLTGMDFGSIMFRGSKATLEISRGGLALYEEDPKRPFEGYHPGSQRWRPEPKLFVESEYEGTYDNLRIWLECIRSRKTPNAGIHVGVQAARAAHLANASLIGGRKAIWDEASQKIALV